MTNELKILALELYYPKGEEPPDLDELNTHLEQLTFVNEGAHIVAEEALNFNKIREEVEKAFDLFADKGGCYYFPIIIEIGKLVGLDIDEWEKAKQNKEKQINGGD